MSTWYSALLLSTVAGLATGVGSLISLFMRDYRKEHLSFFLGFSAGLMLYISFTQLLPESIEGIGFAWAHAGFFVGMIVFLLIDLVIPYKSVVTRKFKHFSENDRLLSCGCVIALGIAIHNFPEGFAVTMTSIKDFSLALPLVVAIALHNIPEGIAVAMPLYYATKSRKIAFWGSLASGLTEPLGAALGLVFLAPILTIEVLSFVLAVVAGFMTIISFEELLPMCFEHNKGRYAVTGIILGIGFMSVSVYLL